MHQFASRSLLTGLLVLSCASSTLAQRPKQYKRIHQDAFKKVIDGKTQQAIEDLSSFLAKYPDDAESHYMLAVAYASENRKQQAIESLERAVLAGLPAGRIVGGTLTGLESLESATLYQELLGRFEHDLVHGPMLGKVSDDGISVWVRTAREATVEVRAVAEGRDGPTIRSVPRRTDPERDFTAVLRLQGLEPQTAYAYQVLVNGQACESGRGRLTTFPTQRKPLKFRLAFGGGAGYVPEYERAWTTIRQTHPDVLLLLGDNIYSDDPQTAAMQHYCYYRRQSRPEFRELIGGTPVYSIWDDHDFGTNDCSGGPRIEMPTWKRPVFEVFRNNWVNPYYGGGDGQPGCFYEFYLGDIHFIMLDGRFYRNLKPEDGGRSSMLGPIQRAWLLDRIQHSEGTIIAMCSPVPWVFEAKGDSRDTWNGFQEERNQIFDFLAEKHVKGVILISADRHRSDLWKIKRPNAYSLFEFNSSRLTNQHVHEEMPGALFSYNKKQSFGLLDFDTTLDDPTITFRIMTIDGDEVYSRTLHHSELQ